MSSVMGKSKQTGKVELVGFCKQDGVNTYTYSVEHNNGETSVEQKMTITSQDGLFDPKWTATIEMLDFPLLDTPEQAAHKLADWMERLAAAIRVGDVQPYSRAKFKEISKG